MFPGFDLSKLPSLSLSQRNTLPKCPAVYFAVDSENRVLYVGRANNLLARWKDHHRQEQLNRINRRNKIKIAWLICPNELKVLVTTEIYFIELYHPLLNRTPVPAKKITPSELVLQQTLRKLVDLEVVVFGFKPAIGSSPSTVYLKYHMFICRTQFISNTGPINNIIQASNNRKSARLKWREYEITKFNQLKVRSWNTSCNGVNIELSTWKINQVNLGPWKGKQESYSNFRPKLGETAVMQTVAGVEMPTLIESELTNILNKYPFVKETYPGVSMLKHDTIPLLWTKH